ncbi:MAG: hypothetical protein ACPHCI_01220 [Solirubrobacterales bacterium]
MLADLVQNLNNRELALLAWALVAIAAGTIWCVLQAEIGEVMKLDVPISLLVAALLLLTWMGTVVALASSIGAWNIALVPDTIFWFLGFAVVQMVRVVTSSDQKHAFKTAALDAVGVTVFIEVFLNLRVFSFPIEVILVLVLSLAILIFELSVEDPKLRLVTMVSGSVLAAVAIGVSVNVFVHLDEVNSVDALRAFALPIWLSAAAIPFFLAISFYALYHHVVRMAVGGQHDLRAGLRVKTALLTRPRVILQESPSFSIYWGNQLASAASVEGAQRVLDDFLEARAKDARAEKQKAEQLVVNAGVDGEDIYGARLDQRQFIETKRALTALATAQMGWYRNRGGHYRPELAHLLKPRFVREGLPEDHGVTLHVHDDGQSWWAWRRTTTGWCFAVGANEPPPNLWEFDGPSPPSGFPGESSEWHLESRNW